MAMESMTKKVIMALVLVMVVVVGVITLNNFKTSANVCPDLYPTYNSSTNNCLNSTFASTSINDVGTALDTSKTAIQTPITYIGIVIIIGILVWIVKEVRKAGK